MQKSNPVTIHIAGGNPAQRDAVLGLISHALHSCGTPETATLRWTATEVALIQQTARMMLQEQEVKIVTPDCLLADIPVVFDTESIERFSKGLLNEGFPLGAVLPTTPWTGTGGARGVMFKDRIKQATVLAAKSPKRISTGSDQEVSDKTIGTVTKTRAPSTFMEKVAEGMKSHATRAIDYVRPEDLIQAGQHKQRIPSVLEHGFFIYVELSSEATIVTARCPVTRLPLPTSLAVRAWVDEAKTVIAESSFYNEAAWTTAQVKNGLETILLDHFATVSSFKGIVVEDTRGQ